MDMVLLQETKKSAGDESVVRSLWPFDSMEFMVVDAEGSAGGLLCIWRPEVFALKDCCSSQRFVLMADFSAAFALLVCCFSAEADLLCATGCWWYVALLQLVAGGCSLDVVWLQML
ncbi:hypothetical protein ACSBR2_003212 [Camellia fascicularis]